MAVVDTNWKTGLSSDSSLPPDLTSSSLWRERKWRRRGLGLTASCWRARVPCSTGSSMALWRTIREVVEVKDTTSEAFMTMMNFIYKAPGEETFNLNDIDCPRRLFEVLELAERYEIANLKKIATSGDHWDKPYEERTWSEGGAKEKWKNEETALSEWVIVQYQYNFLSNLLLVVK